MTIIDFHNHFYPPAYLEAIQAGPSSIKVTIDADGNPLLHYPGDYNIVVPGHRDVDFRARVLEKAGVDMQVLTMPLDISTPCADEAIFATLSRMRPVPQPTSSTFFPRTSDSRNSNSSALMNPKYPARRSPSYRRENSS